LKKNKNKNLSEENNFSSLISDQEILSILLIKKHFKANNELLTDVLFLPSKEETVLQQHLRLQSDSVV